MLLWALWIQSMKRVSTFLFKISVIFSPPAMSWAVTLMIIAFVELPLSAISGMMHFEAKWKSESAAEDLSGETLPIRVGM
jgi:hypothetical protein